MAMPRRQPSGIRGIPREDPATGHRRTPLRGGWTAQTCQTWKARALGVGVPVDSVIQIFLLSFQDSGDEEPGFIL